MADTIPYRFRLRGGTKAEWTAANPILLAREPGVETDTGAFKVGNGTTAWNSLPYTGRNTATLLAEADSAAAARITAESLPTLRQRVTTLETNGTGGTSYNDTQLRSDFAAADQATLTSANTYTDTKTKALSDRLDPIESRPKNVVLTQAAYDALATKDSNTLYFIRS
jgi:hypothetical protein